MEIQKLIAILKSDLFAQDRFHGWLTFLCALFKAVVDLLEHGLAASLEHGQHDALEGVLVRRLNGSLHRFGRCSTNGVRRVLWTGNGSGWEGRGKWERAVGGSGSSGRMRTDTCLGFDHLADVVLQRNLHGCHLGSHRITQLIRHGLQTFGDGWRGRSRNWQRWISRSNNTVRRVQDPSGRRKENSRTSSPIKRPELVSNTPLVVLLGPIQFLP